MNEKSGAGRPKINLDYKLIDGALSMGMTGEDIARLTGHSFSTIKRRFQEDKGLNFEQYRETKYGGFKMSLTYDMRKLARKNGAVMIFMAKNHLGMVDQPVETVEPSDKYADVFERVADALPD